MSRMAAEMTWKLSSSHSAAGDVGSPPQRRRQQRGETSGVFLERLDPQQLQAGRSGRSSARRVDC
jgi:hypothetical protein